MKERILKNLEAFKGKSPVYYALFGVGCVVVFLVTTTGIDVLENWVSGKGSTGLGNHSGQLVLRKQTIRDRRLNMDSHTVYVPEGWKLEGSVQWLSSSFYKASPSPQLTISSPDGISASVYPTVSFVDPRPSRQMSGQYGYQRPRQGASYEGLPVCYLPESNSDWKRLFQDSLIQERHPNAKNIQVNRVAKEPEFTRGLEKQYAPFVAIANQQNAEARSYGLPMQQKVEIKGMIVESTFTENGIEKECISLVGVYAVSTSFPGNVKISWNTCPNLSFVAPKGKLESTLPKLIAILSTNRPLPNWNQKIRKMFTPQGQTTTTRYTTNNVGKTYSDILDISHNGFRKRQGMVDAGQSKYVNSVHEIKPYSHNGTQYQLPSGYDHVYTNNHDTIILTDDALLKPNVDFGGSHDWTKMNSGN